MPLLAREVAWARIVRDARALAVKETTHEGKIEGVGHDVGRSWAVFLLEELILELKRRE